MTLPQACFPLVICLGARRACLRHDAVNCTAILKPSWTHALQIMRAQEGDQNKVTANCSLLLLGGHCRRNQAMRHVQHAFLILYAQMIMPSGHDIQRAGCPKLRACTPHHQFCCLRMKWHKNMQIEAVLQAGQHVFAEGMTVDAYWIRQHTR